MKTKKKRKPRLCHCWYCEEGRKEHQQILIKNRQFITSATNKIFHDHSKKLLQLRLFLDFENAKRKGEGRQDGKKSK